MKKFLCLIVFLSFTAGIFAAQGLLWGKAPLRTVSTKWFDIIYPEDSSESAKKLYENADSIYEEIAQMYGFDLQYKMPVILTPDVEIYNAYWSSGYYNHIVLYDTAISNDMAVFSDDLLSTFRHEVTHAYTYNMKAGFWKFLSNIMGDAISGGGFTVSSGLAEGATLTSESFAGEGRLNSEYAKQMVRQAKIEECFPEFQDMQGEADRLPTGSFYYFNGAFNEYLQKKYGMDKYAQLWFRAINGKNFTFGRAFYKVYKIKLKSAWKDFLDTYYIPEVEKNPVEANLVNDFFNKADNRYSKNNLRGSLYSSLNSSSTGLFYIDEQTDSLYFVENQQLQNETIKPERLFTFNNLIEAKPSTDGRFIALSYYDINSPNIKIKAAVYDTESKSIFKIKGTGLNSVSIIQHENNYYLAGLKFHSQNKALILNKLIIEKNRLNDCIQISEIPLPENTTASDFTDLQNGNFAFILRSKLCFSICTASVDGLLIDEYKLSQDKIELRKLSYNPPAKELIFSYTTKDQMPQLGKLSIESKDLKLWKENLSGGVYEPVVYNDQLYFIGNFYMQNRLFTKAEEDINYTVTKAQNSKLELASVKTVVQDSLPYSKYNPGKYLFKGMIIPLSTASSIAYDPYHYGTTPLPWGFTFTTNSPWDSTTMILTAGFGYLAESFGIDFQLSSGTSTSLFKYGIETAIEFDKLGFKQTTEQLALSTGFYTGKHSSLYLGNNSIFHYGRSNENIFTLLQLLLGLSTGNLNIPDKKTNYLYGTNQTQLTYSNVIKTGPGRDERYGFSATAMIAWIYNGSTGTNAEVFKNGGDIGFAARFYIPKLLPFNNKQGIITNLPSKISLNLFLVPQQETSIELSENFGRSTTDFPTFTLASARFDTILFEKDIQKTIKFFPLLFASDFQLSFSYMAGIDCNEMAPASDNWKIKNLGKYINLLEEGSLQIINVPYIKATIGLTPSFGGAASADYKQLICFRAGLFISKEKVIPVYDFALDLKF